MQDVCEEVNDMNRLILFSFLWLVGCNPSFVPADASLPESEAGSVPIERCMNLGGALESPVVEGEWGYTIRRSDLLRLKQAGFDTIRLPLRWSTRMAETPPYAIDQAYLERVDEIIVWAGQIGLNIIINVHHYTQLNEDPDQHEPRLEALWDQLAYHYATAPDFLIFEFLNEPYSKMSVRRTDALNRRLLERIRVDNPDRWVILSTANWGTLDGLRKSRPPYDARAILTYHDYLPFEFTHQGAPWAENVPPLGLSWGTPKQISDMQARLDRAKAIAQRYRMPLFVGEFGVYEKVPTQQRAKWIRAMREGLEARDLAWCHWDYATTLRAYDLDREDWIPEIRAALLD